jgi:CheY-like chemotaxis protein/HPt (histidine-containing phosphotransfer) domain-containing protein
VSSFNAHQPEIAETEEKIYRVLVADDSDTSRAVTVHALTTMGLDVDAVADGEEAVIACESRRYDLILMDFHMPKLDGCEATLRIRASEAHRAIARTTIIALSASGVEEDLIRCREVGMDGHLFKLMPPQELRDALRSWLTAPSPLGRGDEAVDTHAPGAAADPTNATSARTTDAGSIDWTVIDALRQFSTDDDLLREILDSFHHNVNSSLPELERAARAGEAETTRFIAHRLRGTCGNIGAVRMQFLYARIEELGRAGVTAGASELISDLWSEYARVRAALGEGGSIRDGIDRR